MNKKLFLYLYNLSKNNKILEKLFILISSISAYVFFIIYFLAVLYLLIFDYNKLIRVLLVPAFTVLLNIFLRKVFKAKRPFDELNINKMIEHKSNYSFPSNHCVCSMIISVSIIYINIKLGFIMIILTIFTALSRIMTGLHYPSDVVAGLIIGLITGIFGFYII